MSTTPTIVLSDVEVAGRPCDVALTGGQVARIEPAIDGGDIRIDGGGGVLLPGLHDHHIHLLATAAAGDSVDVSNELGELTDARPRDGWIRAVGLDGELDRDSLDAVRSDIPVRVQHRGGSLWVLNSAAIAAAGLDEPEVDGIERDAAGRPTGRLWRLDAWLAERTPRSAPDLRALGTQLAAYGITGVTDATPELTSESQELVSAVPQRLTLLAAEPTVGTAGPLKIVMSDHDLPGPDELAAQIRIARAQGRTVAIHVVTRAALIVTLAAFDDVDAIAGDRIEHAAVVPPEARDALRRHGLTVVTQPSLVARRGDDYLDRSEPEDAPYLWPYASLLEAGVRVVASSDAPYGDPDPWATMRAARDRTTPTGRIVGPAESVRPAVTLAGFLSPADDPGGPARTVLVGAPADLVLLDVPLAGALAGPSADHVRATLIDGRLVHGPG